jgi:hypothetical protein
MQFLRHQPETKIGAFLQNDPYCLSPYARIAPALDRPSRPLRFLTRAFLPFARAVVLTTNLLLASRPDKLGRARLGASNRIVYCFGSAR